MLNLRLAVRQLVRAPFLAAIAILSLALGIGATAAIFSLFNQLLLRFGMSDMGLGFWALGFEP